MQNAERRHRSAVTPEQPAVLLRCYVQGWLVFFLPLRLKYYSTNNKKGL